MAYLVGVILALIGLTGCGSAAANERPIFTPIKPDPSTVLPKASSTPLPTPLVSDPTTLQSYTHQSHRFSLHYPENWQLFERPDGLILIEPGNQAGYSVYFKDVGEQYSAEELSRYLVTFVAQNFAGSGSRFSVISPEQVVDDAAVAQFKAFDPNLGEAINEIRVSQTGTIVFVTLISATESQWDLSQEDLQALADTLTIQAGPAKTATPEPTGAAPVWTLIGPTSNQFGFLAPSDWEISTQNQTTVVVGRPDSQMSFQASYIPAVVQPGPEAAAAAAQDYLAEITGAYQDVESLPPADFPLAQTDGKTIDFLFTNQDGLTMAGSIITTYQDGKIYRIVFTAPARFYETALEWFNPMLHSFAILSPEDLLVE